MPKGKKRRNKGGRPPAFKSANELSKRINAYFDAETGCFPIKDKDTGEFLHDKHGKIMFEVMPPTVSGLALFLGFCDRQSLYDYKSRPEFSCIIKKAVLQIERFHEGRCATDGKPVGSIFWLKNHKWKDDDAKVAMNFFTNPLQAIRALDEEDRKRNRNPTKSS